MTDRQTRTMVVDDDAWLDDVDPGIRRTVAWLRSHGFNTTDSGDGVTKFRLAKERGEEPMDCAIEIPHVHIPLKCAENGIATADRLMRVLRDQAGLVVNQGDIQVVYDPAVRMSILSLYNVDDARLFGTHSGGHDPMPLGPEGGAE